ncbi:unnamed protein product [Malus baccata var. baccata]
MQKEFNELKAQGTWELVSPLENRMVIGSKWVYKVKKNFDGSVARYKARLVAQGFSQEQGLDYSKTLVQLKQAPRAWNSKFTNYLPALGFVAFASDTSLLVKNDDKDVVVLLLYMDDIILIGSSVTKVQQVIEDLAGVFDLKDIGRLTYFLGLQIQYKENEDIFVNQSKYVKDLIHKARMESCKPANTPCKPHTDSAMRLTTFSDVDWVADLNTIRSMTGYVVYLGGNPISWQSKKQTSVSRSSTEAEYKALAHTVADVAWIRLILKDLGVVLLVQPTIYCDNTSAIALSANPVYHSRIKHLDTDYHFVQERVHQGDLKVEYLPTDEQTTDILTKVRQNFIDI